MSDVNLFRFPDVMLFENRLISMQSSRVSLIICWVYIKITLKVKNQLNLILPK